MLESLQVVIEVVHQLCHISHQLRINGFRRFDVFIHRLEDPLAHNSLPHSVRDHRRELLSGSGNDPISELLAAVAFILAVRHSHGFTERRPCTDQFPRIPVTVLVVRRQLDPTLSSTSQRHSVDPVPEKLCDLVIMATFLPLIPKFPPQRTHQTLVQLVLASGECREVVKIHTLGLAERIVVALRTLHPRSEENPHRVREIVERHATVDRVVADRCRFRIPAISRTADKPGDELVPRHIFVHRLTYPVTVRLVVRPATLPPVAETEQIERPVGHLAGIALGTHQITDKFLSLRGILDFEKCQCLLRSGYSPDRNEKSPPHVSGVIRHFRNRKLLPPVK